MIGSIIDRYEVLQKLGEGATASVYRARHVSIGREVALKVLHPHLSASTRYRERFHREARAVGRLNHPNIVSIQDYSGVGAQDCYIVTELVEGVTLLQLLQDAGPLPSEVAASVGADLASALAFAHRQGVVHRDVKPENIMIRRDGRVKLMDFGVARVLDEASLTMDGSLLGSPAYMSPEQAVDGPLDGRTDLFSLGTVLFHSVAGQVPFGGTNPSVILRNIIEGTRPELLEIAPTASPALAAVVDRLLSHPAEARPPDADAAESALLATLADVGLARDHALLDLRGWIEDPGARRTALDAYLQAELLRGGRARLASGDTLGALQRLNRLLAMDEENAEVIALVQSLHEPAGRGRSRWWTIAAAVLVGGAAVGGVAWSARHMGPSRGQEAGVGSAERSTEGAARGSASKIVGAVVTDDPAARGAPAQGDTTGQPSTLPAALASDAAVQASSGVPVEGAGGGGGSPLRNASPTSHRPPSLAGLPGRTGTTVVATSRPGGNAIAAASLATSAGAAERARIVLQIATPVEVWLDNGLVGYFRMGPSDKWIGTRGRPLEIAPGEHLVALRNNAVAEPWEQRIVVQPGETRVLSSELRRKPVTFQIDPSLPTECRVRVGAAEYGTVRDFGASFSLREPEADARVVFRCPPPLGEFSEAIGPTFGGEFLVVPRQRP